MKPGVTAVRSGAPLEQSALPTETKEQIARKWGILSGKLGPSLQDTVPFQTAYPSTGTETAANILLSAQGQEIVNVEFSRRWWCHGVLCLSVACFAYSSAVKMEARRSLETSVSHPSKRLQLFHHRERDSELGM